MRQGLFIIIVLCCFVQHAYAQIGGESTYQFLELTNSARIAALGGNQVALHDSTDLNLPYHNPALLSEGMSNRMQFNYTNYLADINFGYAAYARSYERIGNFAAGIHYINYGEFDEATELGELTGNQFTAAEYAFHLYYSNSFKKLYYGATLKPVYSAFESYQSFGMALDLGIVLRSKNGLTNVGMVASNIGGQITTYYEDGAREKIPFNLQAGISQRLKHAPIILSLTLDNLSNWKLSASENDEDELALFEREESFGQQIMRHTVIGMEVLPSDNFIIRAGYNYQRRQELKFDDRVSTVGFSFGFGVRINRFRLDYGISRFHLAGSSNLISLAVNLNDGF